MSDNLVSITKQNHIAFISMNSPKNLNALTYEMCTSLLTAFDQCENDSDIRVIVLSGVGKAFCAGGDLKTIMLLDDFNAAKDYVTLVGSLALAIFKSNKIFIAKITGAAAGAGFNMALACDFIIADENSQFTQAFSQIGLISDCGGNYLLPHLTNPITAKKLILLPTKITADVALKLGIITETANSEEINSVVEKLALTLTASSPQAMTASKKILNNSEALEKTLEREAIIQAQLIVSTNCKEGIKAFFEKRKPVFVS